MKMKFNLAKNKILFHYFIKTVSQVPDVGRSLMCVAAVNAWHYGICDEHLIRRLGFAGRVSARKERKKILVRSHTAYTILGSKPCCEKYKLSTLRA